MRFQNDELKKNIDEKKLMRILTEAIKIKGEDRFWVYINPCTFLTAYAGGNTLINLVSSEQEVGNGGTRNERRGI